MKPHKRNLIVMLWAVALVSGCSGFQPQPGGSSPEQLLSEARGPEENRRLHTDLIRQMIDQDRLYAAYAHLEAQERNFGDNLELKLLRAEIQRKLGRNVQAEADYKALLNTPYAGYAQHGLGLIYARQNIARGTEYLRKAVELRPTDARIRNDLGYALIRQNKLAEARLHLATAFQLDSDSNLSRNNYLLLLILEDDRAGIRRVARETQISPQQMARIEQQASELSTITKTPARSAVPPAARTPASSSARSSAHNRATVAVGGGGG